MPGKEENFFKRDLERLRLPEIQSGASNLKTKIDYLTNRLSEAQRDGAHQEIEKIEAMPQIDVRQKIVLAGAYERIGDKDKAEELYRELDSNEITENLSTYPKIISVLEKSGHEDMAKKIREKIIKNDEEKFNKQEEGDTMFVEIGYRLSEAYKKNGEKDKSDEIMLKVAQRAEQDNRILGDAAEVYKEIGNEKKYREVSLKAGQALEKYAKEKDDEYFFAAGKRYKEGGEEDKAKEMLEKFLQKYGEESYFGAQALVELGQLDKAKTILLKKAKKFEDSQDYKEAINYYNQILELDREK